MIQFKLQMILSCEAQCGATTVVDLLITSHRLRRLLEDSNRLEEDDLPADWALHTSGGWGSTDFTKTQLLCADCVKKWNHGTVRRGTRGPLTRISLAGT